MYEQWCSNSSIWDEDALKHLDKYLNFYKLAQVIVALPLIQKFIDKKNLLFCQLDYRIFREINNTLKFITRNSFIKER